MKMRKRAAGLVLAAGLALLGGIAYGRWKQDEGLRFVQAMGNGINLGNTLDSTNLREYQPDADELEYETFWGNPKISRQQLRAVAGAGFGTVRIPVTWEDHMDEQGKISQKWLDRVQEVADMALEEGLYVILNTHHEEWLDLETARETEITERYRYVWEQIAERFADYDNRLLFEGMNEPRLRGSDLEWKGGDEAMRAMVNRLNEAFVETVRDSGSKNRQRYLLIGAYANMSRRDILEELEVPQGHVIVSVHEYLPYRFCQQEDGTAEWDAFKAEDVQEITEAYDTMYRLFIEKHIPVIVTEFGCVDKENTKERMEWTSYQTGLSREYGIPCIWWDNGSSYALLDRENAAWYFPELVDILTGQEE